MIFASVENKGRAFSRYWLALLSLLLLAALLVIGLPRLSSPGLGTSVVDGVAMTKKLPSRAAIKVPFTTQSPFADWGMPYQEACEEASVLIVDFFLKKKKFDPKTAEREILKVVKWQEDVFGDYIHTDVDATVRMIKEYFGYKKVRVIEDVTAKQIKEEIVAGNPVIVPTAGRLLFNKYFRRPGPIYHMLVVTGYNGGTFITNDPGTRRGEGYKYSEKVLINALHDWMGSDETVTQGKKRAIVIEQ